MERIFCLAVSRRVMAQSSHCILRTFYLNLWNSAISRMCFWFEKKDMTAKLHLAHVRVTLYFMNLRCSGTLTITDLVWQEKGTTTKLKRCVL